MVAWLADAEATRLGPVVETLTPEGARLDLAEARLGFLLSSGRLCFCFSCLARPHSWAMVQACSRSLAPLASMLVAAWLWDVFCCQRSALETSVTSRLTPASARASTCSWKKGRSCSMTGTSRCAGVSWPWKASILAKLMI